ncbi:unnamed protein product [Callosobruchus maculatus]|nr:unnamed protein product [Callosobruchus maculatus]
MVWMIMNNLDTEGAKADIHSRVPFVEKTWLTPVNEELPEYVRDSMGFIKKEYEKGPVCLKTHLPWVLLPRDIQENLKKPKIIYVLRDPKDAMLSLYHFIKILTGFKETMEEFCEGYMQNKQCYLPYWSHVLGFWNQRNKPNVLILRYEEMIKDLSGIVRKVSHFLERPISDDEVEKLVGHLSFNSMKKNRAVNNEDLIEKARKAQGLEKTETNHMRQGKTGGHKTEMTPELIQKLDKWIEDNTRDTDFVVW